MNMREFIKGRLKKEGKLEDSMNELSVRELGEIISRLENILYPIGEGTEYEEEH